jgi:hypothetical protein
MAANNSDFLRGQIHGDSTNQGVYNEGSTLDPRAFGGNGSQTSSGSDSEQGLPGSQSQEYEGQKSNYSGNAGIGSKGFGG